MEEKQDNPKPVTTDETPAYEGHAPSESPSHVESVNTPAVKVRTTPTSSEKTGRGKKPSPPPTLRRSRQLAAQVARASLKKLSSADEED